MERSWISHQETSPAAGAGWETPKRAESRIPAVLSCPPPPKKKTIQAACGQRQDPPKNGYFHPPDLETLFALAPRREACV